MLCAHARAGSSAVPQLETRKSVCLCDWLHAIQTFSVSLLSAPVKAGSMKGSRRKATNHQQLRPLAADFDPCSCEANAWAAPAQDACTDEHDPWQCVLDVDAFSHPSQAFKRKRFVGLQANAQMLAARPADQQTFSTFQQKGMDPQVVKRRWGHNAHVAASCQGVANMPLA